MIVIEDFIGFYTIIHKRLWFLISWTYSVPSTVMILCQVMISGKVSFIHWFCVISYSGVLLLLLHQPRSTAINIKISVRLDWSWCWSTYSKPYQMIICINSTNCCPWQVLPSFSFDYGSHCRFCIACDLRLEWTPTPNPTLALTPRGWPFNFWGRGRPLTQTLRKCWPNLTKCWVHSCYR